PVSMPLDWSELNEVSGPAAFTLGNVPRRLETRPKDPWGNFFDAAVPLE
ncbi:DNA ligase, partial [Rhizobium ruizarguesonis]